MSAAESIYCHRNGLAVTWHGTAPRVSICTLVSGTTHVSREFVNLSLMGLWVGASALGAGQGARTSPGRETLLTLVSALCLSPQAPVQSEASVLSLWFHFSRGQTHGFFEGGVWPPGQTSLGVF